MPFDPYQLWLEIPPGDGPPDAYALLDIDRFEPNAQVIRDATQKRIGLVRARADWDQVAESRRVISELLSAQSTLLDEDRKRAYDASLQTRRESKTTDAVADSVTTLSLDDILPLELINSDRAANENSTLSLELQPERVGPESNREQPQPTLSLAAPADHPNIVPIANSKTQPFEKEESPSASRRAAATVSLVDTPQPAEISVPLAAVPTPETNAASDKMSVLDSDENQDRHIRSVITYAAVALCICVLITLIAGRFRQPVESQVADASANEVKSTSNVSTSSNRIEHKSTAVATVPDATNIANGELKPANDSTSELTGPNSSSTKLVTKSDGAKTVQPVQVQPKVEPQTNAPLVDAKVSETNDAGKPVVLQKPPAAPALNLTSLPRILPDFESTADRAEYVSRLGQMMYDGLGTGRSGLVLAENSFESARQLTRRDPRLYYGYALVLWKRLRFDEARTQLEAAIHTDDNPYWPAWAALVRFHLARKEHEIAFQNLIEMAEAVNKSHAAAVDQKTVIETTKWIGRLVGYLEEPANAVFHQKESLVALDDQVVASLGSGLRQHYSDSKTTLRDDYAAVAKSTQHELDKIDTEKQERLKASQAKVSREKKEQEDATDQLNLSAEKWKQRIDEQMQDFDQQLKEMSSSYSDLEIEAGGITVSLQRLNRDIDNLFPTNNRRISPQHQNLMDTKRNQRDQLQARYRVLEKNANDLRKQARTVLQKRQNAVDQYKKATGKLINQSDELRKWSKVLDRRRKSKDRKNAGRIRTLKRQAHALNTYLPFDLKVEKDRVIESIPKD